MSYTVRLDPRGAEFTVGDDETVLVAAERQGQRLTYGCRHGRCSSCKYQILEGDVDQPDASIYSLSDAEREEGWALVCCAYPVEDLVLLDETEADLRARPMLLPTEHECQVRTVQQVTAYLWRLQLTRPPDVHFYAGQFFELQAPGRPDVWRPYSVASAPEDTSGLTFVIKRLEGGAFSGGIGPSLVGGTIPVRGPFGDAYLRDGTDDVVLVSTGSGIAPALSILSHAAQVADGRRFRLFYGARTPDAVAIAAHAKELRDTLHLDIDLCVSQPGEGWQGACGRVTPTVQRQVGDASAIDAYLCGHPDMCAQVTLLLEAKGIGERNLFADPFWSSAGA
jgi:propane monooxygenase reductase subunit